MTNPAQPMCNDGDKFPAPRPFQLDAHQALRQGFKDGHKNQLVMAPTGAGKTYLGLRICREAVQRGKRAVFLCDRTTLINQTSTVADRYGMHEHGIIQAQHWRRRPSELFQIASVQTIAKREYWPKMDVLVVDECFPGDTLISTAQGLVEIRNIRSGDLIYNSMGVGRVDSVFSKPANNFVKVRTTDGKTFRCTPDHPIFTGMGWKPAGTLGVGEKLFRIQGLQRLWEQNFSKNGEISKRNASISSGITVQESNDLWSILCKEIEEPYAQRIIAGKNAGDLAQDWSQTNNSGRQWSWDDITSAYFSACPRGRVGYGICSDNEEVNEGGVSTPLQAGFGKCSLEGCNRIGRNESLRKKEERARPEEGLLGAFSWVESVEIEERGSDELVYNLRVSGHPSYFAEGILVHNCHTTYKAWTEFAAATSATVIGLSATPFTPGLGKIFTNLVNATTMHDLTQSGVLVPMRIFSCSKPDMTGAKTSGGEWTDKAAEERELQIVGDVVAEWLKFGEGRKTIIFGATIAHCEELCRQFIQAGVMAAVFTSDTDAKDREQLLKEYRKPGSHLKILISVEALAKGFDVPDVACICDARPLRKSLSTAIQMWGRGLRSSPETGKTDCLLLDFSGNIVRFFEDFNEIYFNGLDKLDDGDKLDKKIRDKEEFEAKGCPKCGFKPFYKRCMGCGHERVSQNISEALPGEMKEIFIGTGSNKKKLADSAEHLWHQVSTYARMNSKPENQSGRAWHLFKNITGQETKWSFSKAPDVEISNNVINKIRQLNIAHRKAVSK
jgi:superfamily II DNA or RNA helicase